MYQNLTQGNITKTMIYFALPMILGNLLQQFYNVADTLIVGRFLGRDALADVGSAYTLMTFLTSILLGLSMGAGALFSIYQGHSDTERLRTAVVQAFLLIFIVCMGLYGVVYLGLETILTFLQVPAEVYPLIRQYLLVVFSGLLATFLYNFFACLLRALGNSLTPLLSGDLSRIKCGVGLGSGPGGPLGRGRCGSGHGDCSICLRFGHHPVHPAPPQGSPASPGRSSLECQHSS